MSDEEIKALCWVLYFGITIVVGTVWAVEDNDAKKFALAPFWPIFWLIYVLKNLTQ